MAISFLRCHSLFVHKLTDEIMPQREIEVILARQLASSLAMPIFIVDTDGTLLYYNEPAEGILGRRFDETGALSVSEWGVLFSPLDADGHPMPPEELPLVVALRERHPVHGRLRIQGLDGVLRTIEVTALPLVGQAGRFVGAVAVFWEVNR